MQCMHYSRTFNFPSSLLLSFTCSQTKTFQLLLSSLHVTFGGCTKSDIFSVGVVAFQAACGKHPFINEDLLDVQDKLSPPDFFCVFVKVVFSKIKTKLVV